MSQPASPSLRFWLREATRPLHEAVDAAFSAYRIADGSDYPAFLQAHAAALLPIEQWLEEQEVERLAPDWAQRRRSGALQADLAGLRSAAPAPIAWAGAADDAALWGTLYVLEGSRMGARFLARQVPAGLPTGYLRHGEAEPLWPRFVQWLDAADAGLDRAAVGAAAERTFAAFMQAGRRHAPPQAQA
ncbi:biliverdin-producing heme oxygenase [Verticiella sediminum]|uniref:Biliverdin-producing heme oxygenase n=1 Tax=Verticiella sediminum TaxID=1247510 RepID=A0A556AY84_9BURK|nr:biliverdin-producing heme oxygenase [Verticiella sediminum]TSH97882.1 biliverdin-producing heme oxygenase [Verticiella sediminum]